MVNCKVCEQHTLPKLGVFLGAENISKEKDENICNNYFSCILYKIYFTFSLWIEDKLKKSIKR